MAYIDPSVNIHPLLMRRLCIVIISSVIALLCLSVTHGKLPDNKEQVWITETLQTFIEPSTSTDIDPFGDAQCYAIQAIPALPAEDADTEAWRAYFSQSDRICRNYIVRFECYFPKGTLFAFDHITQTLAIHTHAEANPIIEKWRMIEKQRFPFLINLSTEIIEADASVVGPMITEGLHLTDHDGIWNQMQALIKEGRAESIKQVNLISNDTSESIITLGAKNRMAKSLTLSQENRLTIEYADQSEFELRVEQAYPWSYGGHIGRVALSATLFQSHAAPVSRIQNTRTLGDHLPQQIEWHDWKRIQFKYNGYISDGRARLAGSWATSQNGLPKSKQTAVFFRADVSYLLPEPNEKLKDILIQHASLAPEKSSGPTKKPALPKPPPGMIVKELPIPESFFHFAGKDIRNNARHTTLGFLINEAGIPLPQYSTVNYKPTTGTAVVTTTPEAMEKIEDLIADIKRQSLPDGLNYHLQILEGASSDFAELLKDQISPSWECLKPLIKHEKLSMIDDIILVGKGSYETQADLGTLVQNLARGDATESTAIQLINSNIGTSISILPELGLRKNRLPVKISLKQHSRKNTEALPESVCNLSDLQLELPLEEACYLGSWSFYDTHRKTRLAFLTITKAGPY